MGVHRGREGRYALDEGAGQGSASGRNRQTRIRRRLVSVDLNQNQDDALVSFSCNVGSAALGKSTLLKKLNRRDFAGAQAEFMK